MKGTVPVSYRVDVKLALTGSFAEYTSARGTTLGMATSLALHLKRSGSAGRLVKMPSGEVLDEWAGGSAS